MDRGGTAPALSLGSRRPGQPCSGVGQDTACRGQPKKPPQTAPIQPTGEVLTPRSQWVMHGAAQGVPGAKPQPPLHVKVPLASHVHLSSQSQIRACTNSPICPQLPEGDPAGTAGLLHTGLKTTAPECQRLTNQGFLWRKCEIKRSKSRWNSDV